MTHFGKDSFVVPYTVPQNVIRTNLNQELLRIGVHELKVQFYSVLPLTDVNSTYELLKSEETPSDYDAVGRLCYKPKQWLNELQVATFRQQIDEAFSELQECQSEIEARKEAKHWFGYKAHLRKAKQTCSNAEDKYMDIIKRYAELLWLIRVYD